jgi:UDP-glucose 4-epimerase
MALEIAVTGGTGRLGQVVIRRLLEQGHRIRSLDKVAPATPPAENGAVSFQTVDLMDLEAVMAAVQGCDGIMHLGAIPGPHGHPPGVVYANNTLGSHNVLTAAAALGIKRVCMASSVNAVGGIDSRRGRFDYFPVDEKHPTYAEDDYSLSKWVMEQQGDMFGRRYPDMTLSSLRFHALTPGTPEPGDELVTAEAPVARNLWGWTWIEEGARACELALLADYTGHETFFIIAPRANSVIPSRELAAHAFPEVPIRGDFSGHAGFFDCGKAERLIGWVHDMSSSQTEPPTSSA